MHVAFKIHVNKKKIIRINNLFYSSVLIINVTGLETETRFGNRISVFIL